MTFTWKAAIALVVAAGAAFGTYLWSSDGALDALKDKAAALFGQEEPRPERPPPTVVAEAGTATITRTVEAVGTTTAAVEGPPSR